MVQHVPVESATATELLWTHRVDTNSSKQSLATKKGKQKKKEKEWKNARNKVVSFFPFLDRFYT